MYSNIPVVTCRVSVSGAFGSTSYGGYSARETLAAFLRHGLLSMALTLLHARTVLIAAPMRIERLRLFTRALIPDDTLNGILLTLNTEIMITP